MSEEEAKKKVGVGVPALISKGTNDYFMVGQLKMHNLNHLSFHFTSKIIK